MWPSNSKSKLVILTLLLIGLNENSASMPDSAFTQTRTRFTRGFFSKPNQFQDISNVVTLGDSSHESEEQNVLRGPMRNSIVAIGSSLYNKPRRVIRLGHPCESESQRFDPITQTCYEVGTRGPCGPLMMFIGNDYRPRRNQYLPTEFQNDKVYGHCECDRARYSDLLMVSIRGQCHFLYSQAFCDPGHFLVMDFTKYGFAPVCRLNPCSQIRNNSGLVPFQGHCVKLNAPSILCPHSQDVVTFRKGDLEPTCATPNITTEPKNRRLFRRQITKTHELKCREGYGRLRAGSMKCHKIRMTVFSR